MSIFLPLDTPPLLVVQFPRIDHLAATVPEDGVRVTGVQTVPSRSYAFVTLAIANDAPGHERRLPASGHRGPRRTRTARGDCRVGPHRVRALREM